MLNDSLSVNHTSEQEIITFAEIEQARQYTEQAKASNTRRAYHIDWHHFTSWCESRNVSALPVSDDTVVIYITTLAQSGYKGSTHETENIAR